MCRRQTRSTPKGDGERVLHVRWPQAPRPACKQGASAPAAAAATAHRRPGWRARLPAGRPTWLASGAGAHCSSGTAASWRKGSGGFSAGNANLPPAKGWWEGVPTGGRMGARRWCARCRGRHRASAAALPPDPLVVRRCRRHLRAYPLATQQPAASSQQRVGSGAPVGEHVALEVSKCEQQEAAQQLGGRGGGATRDRLPQRGGGPGDVRLEVLLGEALHCVEVEQLPGYCMRALVWQARARWGVGRSQRRGARMAVHATAGALRRARRCQHRAALLRMQAVEPCMVARARACAPARSMRLRLGRMRPAPTAGWAPLHGATRSGSLADGACGGGDVGCGGMGRSRGWFGVARDAGCCV